MFSFHFNSARIVGAFFLFHVVSAGHGSHTADKSTGLSWVARTNLPAAVSDSTASFLPDLNVVVIAGGCYAANKYDSGSGFYLCGGGGDFVADNVTLYHPSTDEFVHGPKLPNPRYRHTALIRGNKVFFVGGRAFDDSLVTSVDVYDAFSNSFDSSFNFNSATSDACATGEILFGGWNLDYSVGLNTAYELNALGNGLDLVSSSLNVGRGDCGAATIDGRVYVLGGFDSAFSPLNSVEVFDGDSFVLELEPLKAAKGDKAIAVLEGEIYVVGGELKDGFTSVPSQTIEVFTPSFNLHSTEEFGTWFDAGELPSRRFRFPAVAISDSSILTFGGQKALQGTVDTIGSEYPVTAQVYELRKTKDEPTTSLAGSGTTLIDRCLLEVFEIFETGSKLPLRMSYRSVGTGTGKKEFLDGLTDFGSGDVPLTSSERLNFNAEVLQIPMSSVPISVFVGGLETNERLKLSACTLAKIFSGKIDSWNDDSVKKDNPWMPVSGMNTKISVYHRALGSSSTFALSGYLHKACPSEWTFGQSTLINWGSHATSVHGTSQMAEKLRENSGSIGYGIASVIHDSHEVAVEWNGGEYNTAQPVQVTHSSGSALDDLSSVDFIFSKDSFPMVVMSYLYLKRDVSYMGQAGQLLKAMVVWLLSDQGQESLESCGLDALGNTNFGVEGISLLHTSHDSKEYVFESKTTLPKVGAGDYVVSLKRKSLTNEKIEDLSTEIAAATAKLESDIAAVDTSDVIGKAALAISILMGFANVYLLVKVSSLQKVLGDQRSVVGDSSFRSSGRLIMQGA